MESSDRLLLIIGAVCIGFILIYGLGRILTRSKGSWSSHLPLQKPAPRDSFESKGERRARAFLEGYFRAPFIKARPDFLANDVTGRTHNMELDCYNGDLRLAVEYNGQQHYNYTPHFHSSKEAFYNQKYRDKLKGIYCRERGITLIEIPYTVLPRLEQWLEEELKKRGYHQPPPGAEGGYRPGSPRPPPLP